jgi:hypothetical protein
LGGHPHSYLPFVELPFYLPNADLLESRAEDYFTLLFKENLSDFHAQTFLSF